MSWTPFTDHASLLGESPFWHPTERALYWVDIPGRSILRAAASAPVVQSWAMPSEPGCIAPVRGGGLVVALRDGIYRARSWGAALEPLVRFQHDVRTTRFNDGKCDALGRLWAGTIYEPRDQRRAELYCIDMRSGKPQVTLMAHNATTANGVAWSPDQRSAWWADTPRHLIHTWDYEAGEAGPPVLRRHRVFHQFAPKPAGWQPGDGGYQGRPDGAAVDVQGHYLSAMFEGGQLLRLAPDGGVAQALPLPVACPTMPCFGGDDLCTLYVTTARQGRPADELARTPLAGRVLSKRVEVPGLPVNFFDPGP
jgi:sugar lactone lactonase YvrE